MMEFVDKVRLVNGMMPLLEEHEGFREEPYVDTQGVVTIGHGHTRLSESSSRMVMRYALLTEYLPALIQLVPGFSGLSPVRQAVLLNMAYNLGVRGLAGFKRMLAAVQDGRWDDAADEMLDSRWAVQVGKREGQRAAVLSEMMRQG